MSCRRSLGCLAEQVALPGTGSVSLASGRGWGQGRDSGEGRTGLCARLAGGERPERGDLLAPPGASGARPHVWSFPSPWQRASWSSLRPGVAQCLGF